jgi:hypothetical protein
MTVSVIYNKVSLEDKASVVLKIVNCVQRYSVL